MTDKTAILMMMANKVITEQNCVLEVMMGEDTVVAHLRPLDAWEEDEEGWEDMEDYD